MASPPGGPTALTLEVPCELSVAEDLALLRDGLIRLLRRTTSRSSRPLTTARTCGDALVAHRPDVAVVDVRLPPTFTNEGLSAAIEARARLPGLPILILSQHVEPLYARELLSDGTGGVGYLLKDRVSDVASSSTRCAPWPPAAPRWTPRWSPSCCPARPRTSRWPADPRASARCWR